MPYILHIDTSGSTGTIALAYNGVLLAIETTDDTRKQAAVINLMIESVLDKAGIAPAGLQAIAVCGGPGSYTGLRIGMATAKGLCYALDIPLILANKLTLLAGAKQDEYTDKYACYTVLLVAREGEFFITALDATGHEIIAPQHMLEANISLSGNHNNYIITDTSAEKFTHLAGQVVRVDNDVSINMTYWAKEGKQALSGKKFAILSNAEPFYLKEVYTHKPL